MKTIIQTTILFAFLAIYTLPSMGQTPPPAPPDTAPKLRADVS